MSLPVAHGLLGATVVAASIRGVSIKRDWRALLAGAAVAVFPDVDYVFYLGLSLGESWHRSFFPFDHVCDLPWNPGIRAYGLN
jgi:hypothetical protein